jgi:GT2 family glycosyltransferase
MNDALDALIRGEKALGNGEVNVALRWLRRAQNLAPTNSRVLLALAQVLALNREPEAERHFRAVASADDSVVAWLGVAVTCLARGAAFEAAEALSRLASSNAVDPDTWRSVADLVMRQTGLPGWAALDRNGRLHVETREGRDNRQQLVAAFDERPLMLRRRRGTQRFEAALPDEWERGHTITVRFGDTELVGSPIKVSLIASVEGFVDSADGDVHGWAWYPRNPDRAPTLALVDNAGGVVRNVVADDETVQVPSARAFPRPRGFRVPREDLPEDLELVGMVAGNGRRLVGSPVNPAADRLSAASASRIVANMFPASQDLRDWTKLNMPLASAPAHIIGQAPSSGSEQRQVDVVIPVYQSLDITIKCLRSVLDNLPRWARLVVVDDASPDPRVATTLTALAQKHRFILRLETENRGFPGTANIGMSHDARRDVVLLNSDTLVPPRWLDRLREAAYSDSRIGTVTPLSNDATIMSYPSVQWTNPVPDQSETIRLDGFADAANRGSVIDVPTGVGFCMYVKRDCINDVGLLREDLFGQGYGEENDFCIRGRHLGWRHVSAPGIFVAHVGGQSFGSTKEHLIKRNLRLLNRVHPGYDELIRSWQRSDPLAHARKAIDIARWRSLRSGAPAVLIVTHGRGGGVQRRVAERAATLREEGMRPILIWPDGRREGSGRDCVLGDGPEGGTPNLRFHVPEELDALCSLLINDTPVRGEVHHLVGHDHALIGIFQRLNIPYEVVIHDYSWFCPRINLVRAGHFCGEPDVAQCENCILDHGSTNDEAVRPTNLRARSANELEGAARIVVPSNDVATRIKRHFPSIAAEVKAWEDDTTLPPPDPVKECENEVLVAVVGAIGLEKGYEGLLASARNAAEQNLPLRFKLVGYSMDDMRLLETGRVDITGRYEEVDAVSLIRAQETHVGWLPSVWPETWCYTLTQMWQAGLQTVAFDIGAPAERIRRTGRGLVLPLGLTAGAVNMQLLRYVAARIPRQNAS